MAAASQGMARAEIAQGAPAIAGIGEARLRIEVIDDFARLQAQAGYWRELEALATSPIVFQSAGWCLHYLRTAQAAGRKIDFQVYFAYQGDRLVAVWPLKREQSLGTTVLSDLTDPYGQYSDIVIDAGIDAGPVLDALFVRVRAGNADTLLLRKVRADAAFAAWLRAKGARFAEGEEAPAINFEAGATIESIRSQLSVKRRKNLRNYRNKLRRQGNLIHDVIVGGARASVAIRRSLELRQELMEEQGATSRAYRDGLMSGLVAGLCLPGAAEIELLVMHLRVGDEDVAIQWGMVHNRRYYAYIAARNPAFDEVSPGTMHLEDVLATCIANGIGTADLLAPAVAYKRTWANGFTPVQDASLAITNRGQAMAFWQQNLRPMARNAFLALPSSARRPLARLLRTKA